MLLCTVSCSVISKQLQEEAEPDVAYGLIVQNPEKYIGKIVIVGGYISGLQDLQGQTVLTILQTALGLWHDPLSKSKSEGYFTVLYKKGLDSKTYRKGRRITIAGTVVDSTVVTMDDKRYIGLHLRNKESYLWPN
jgi:starvation-inducible outer membrane lipoprotein